MGLIDLLFGRDRGSSSTIPVTGSWLVSYISVAHPFGRYFMDLRSDGSLAWAAVVPTTDAGDIHVNGIGTWHTIGDALHYTSGESSGKLRYSFDGDDLILEGLPATKVGPGARCVFKKTTSRGGPTNRSVVKHFRLLILSCLSVIALSA